MKNSSSPGSNPLIHLAFAFDLNYLLPFHALAASIFDKHPDVSFSFHCIARDLPEDEKELIVHYITSNRSTILFHEADDELISRFPTMNHWNSSVYYKIFFPLLLNEVADRVLYLDTDTLVLNSLLPLYTMDMQNRALAAVHDPYVQTEAYSELHKKEYYFNSGVMLIDVKKWNDSKISQRTFDLLENHPEQIHYVDQDALNVVLQDEFVLAADKFNYTSTHMAADVENMTFNEKLNSLVVIHFTMSRPWQFLCTNRMRRQYRVCLRKSPKKDERVITDFTFSKIPAFFRIRLREIYMDSPRLRKVVKTLRRLDRKNI